MLIPLSTLAFVTVNPKNEKIMVEHADKTAFFLIIHTEEHTEKIDTILGGISMFRINICSLYDSIKKCGNGTIFTINAATVHLQ